ncbi:MAG: hypothetical protein ABFD75_13190 [Smithella sp.]
MNIEALTELFERLRSVMGAVYENWKEQREMAEKISQYLRQGFL